MFMFHLHDEQHELIYPTLNPPAAAILQLYPSIGTKPISIIFLGIPLRRKGGGFS